MPVLVPRRGYDFLGNKVYWDYSPPLYGGRGFSPHHVVSEVERILKAYKIDLPRYYDTYGNAPAETRSRQWKYFSHVNQQNIFRVRKRRIESGLFSKSFKRQGRFSYQRYGRANRRSYGRGRF